MTTTTTDYYRVLGLASNASNEDIKRGYKRLAVKYHPDKTSDKGHHELFIKIQEAYETLKDPEKRRKYDLEKGKSNCSSYSSYATSASTSASKSGRNTGYYGFYQHFYKSYQNSNMAERQKFAQEEKIRRDRENQAAKAAKLAKEKINEQLREEEIRIKKEQKAKKEQEIKKQQEFESTRGKENKMGTGGTPYNERKKDAYRKEWENAFCHFAQEDDILDQYFFERRKAQNRAKDSGSSATNEDPPNKHVPSQEQETSNADHLDQHGHDSNDPIVLDDDDDGVEKQSSKLSSNSTNAQTAASLATSNNTGSYESDSDDDEFVSVLHHSSDNAEESAAYSNLKGVESLFNARMNLRPRQEPSRLSKSRRSTSPSRNKPVAPSTSYVRNNINTHEPPKSKRPKSTPSFGFDDLKNNLGVDIGNVDFTEVLESLPGNTSSEKTRKISDDISSNIKSKRPRVAEFTNGSTKADTLHIPINKNSVKGHALPSNGLKKVLTVLDLHASPTIHNYASPTPPRTLLGKRLTEDLWFKYVSSIRNYQSEFLNYKKHIVQYQLERSKKDEEYYELINSSSACFEVYQQCLERDFKVLQEYTELLRVFNSTMDIYKQNCNWIRMSNK